MISDSEVVAKSFSGNYPALVAAYDVIISNGIVNVSTDGQDYGIWANRDVQIRGAADVASSGLKGAIGSGNSFTVIPSDGKLVDIWMGDSENNVSRYGDSPISEETVITEDSLYFHSKVHTHTFDMQIISDSYKASDATCIEPAKYYYSCECGEKGTEVFANGIAVGHNYKDGKCTVCLQIPSWSI